MTTPNLPWGSTPDSALPQGVYSPGQLATTLQDHTAGKFQALAGGRFPAIVGGTSAGSPLDSLGPLGFVVSLASSFFESVASADPDSITGPEDLVPLVADFFEGLPVVGQFIDLKDALFGDYEGDDPVLQFIQDLFGPIRRLLELASGGTGVPSIGDLESGWSSITAVVSNLLSGLIPVGLLTQGTPNRLANGGFSGLVSLEAADGWSWDDTIGLTSPGSATVTADGTRHVLLSESLSVEAGQAVDVSGAVKWSSLTGTGTAFELSVREFTGETVTGTTVVDSMTATGSGGFTAMSGSHTVGAGVDSVRVMIVVTENATAGQVWWDDLDLHNAATSLPQQWITGLESALVDLWAKFSDLWEKITGKVGATISDVLSYFGQLQTILGGGSVGSPLPNLAGTAIGGMNSVLNQIADILAGNIVTPINSLVQDVKDWFDSWFGGGSTNAIPLSQKGAASGVAPLNSSSKVATSYLQTNVASGVAGLNGSGKIPTSLLVTDTASNIPTLDGSGKIQSGQLPAMNYIPTGDKGAANGVAPLNSNSVVPLSNLPEEVGGTGGTGAGNPYVILYYDASKSLANNSAATLDGWLQLGTTSVTFESGSNARFKFGLAGLWDIRFSAYFPASTTGYRRAWIDREITAGGSAQTYPIIEGSATANSQWANGLAGYTTLYASTIQRAAAWSHVRSGVTVNFDSDDWFSVGAYQNSGGALLLAPGLPGLGGTLVTCTYLGAA